MVLEFKAGIETPIVSVKIQFLWLPINFYDVKLFISIAMAASVAIEVDLQNSLPDRIWISIG